MSEIFTREEAWKILRISESTLDRKREAGLLPFHTIGSRIVLTESDINHYLNVCAVPAIDHHKNMEILEQEKTTGGKK